MQSIEEIIQECNHYSEAANYKLKLDDLVRLIHSDDIFKIKFGVYKLSELIINFAKTDKSKISQVMD